jgi:hypothetical protein
MAKCRVNSQPPEPAFLVSLHEYGKCIPWPVLSLRSLMSLRSPITGLTQVGICCATQGNSVIERDELKLLVAIQYAALDNRPVIE